MTALRCRLGIHWWINHYTPGWQICCRCLRTRREGA